MKKLLINHWKELSIVCVYIAVACLAYGVWFNSLWGKWYINLITVLVITAIGVVIGFFYIKGKIKEDESMEKMNEENKAVENEKAALDNNVEGE